MRIDYRLGASDADRIRSHAAELASIAPDVILAVGATAVGALRQATRTLPIVFANVVDPVGAGFVDSLSRPGGNATGFTNYEYGISGKWLELLKEIAPSVQRAAVLRDATNASGMAAWGAIQAIAPSLRVELTPINISAAAEIERTVSAFA